MNTPEEGAACAAPSIQDDLARLGYELADSLIATERLKRVEAELTERMTKESGRALIEDANRWQHAYNEARDEVVRLQIGLREISTKRLDETLDDHDSLAQWHAQVLTQARALLREQP